MLRLFAGVDGWVPSGNWPARSPAHGTTGLTQSKGAQRDLWAVGHAMADLEQAIRLGL